MKIKFFAIIANVVILAFVSCQTDSGDVAKDRRGRVTNAVLENIAKAVGKVALATITNAVTQQVDGKKVDFAQAASTGLWTNAGSIVDSSSVESVINAWSGNQIKPVAAMAAEKFKEANPTTPSEKQAVVAAIATSISNTTAVSK